MANIDSKLVSCEELYKIQRTKESPFLDDGEPEKTIDLLKKYLHKHEDVIAISAPQLGIDRRIFCMRTGVNDEDIMICINPLLSNRVGIHMSVETLPPIEGEWLLPRNDSLSMTYQDEHAKIHTVRLESILCDNAQQMVDIMDGIFVNSYGLELDEEWHNATKEERAEVVEWYLDELKKKKALLDIEIENTPELKEIRNARNFMIGAATGRIKTIEEDVDLPIVEDSKC